MKIGNLVRFNHERDGGPVHRVVSVMSDGMIEIHDMGGYFAPHLFTVATDIADMPPHIGAPDHPALLPCPFCGSSAEIERDNDHHGEWFNLGCSRHWGRVDPDDACPGGRLWYTEEPANEARAIAAWNTRAVPPALQSIDTQAIDLDEPEGDR